MTVFEIQKNGIGYVFALFQDPLKIAKNCVLLYLLSGNYCQIVTIFFCTYLIHPPQYLRQ
jgi:hypothetical protein